MISLGSSIDYLLTNIQQSRVTLLAALISNVPSSYCDYWGDKNYLFPKSGWGYLILTEIGTNVLLIFFGLNIIALLMQKKFNDLYQFLLRCTIFAIFNMVTGGNLFVVLLIARMITFVRQNQLLRQNRIRAQDENPNEGR